ncbi:MAG: GNAT family N-acetyltransferase [Candidatus Dormibacteraeota bacterium]|uniref:GNAT family N-acetyltransferase n=1 Tax=Candidatus Aeolococcus gillhamiae TaxID=3127015 RepID=A0A934JW71_9BACT|nr:GNAT family N-acetyltransferase [Candidatus Dormibacteraeota bacterium]
MSQSDPQPLRAGPGDIAVRDVALSATKDLRARVLRNHIPGSPAHTPSDDLADTWHLGAFRGDRLVGVVTVFPQDAPGHPGVPAQRFRFMAVEPSEQGTGAGSALMKEVIGRARARGDRLLWANGRDTALDFYVRLGFEVADESFTESNLPHHVVVRRIS